MKYKKQWSGKLWKLPSFWYASLASMQILVVCLFPPVRLFLVHIITHCGVISIDWRMYNVNCNVKCVSGDEESNARKTQVYVVLAGKPCCVSNLYFNLQIYWNSYLYSIKNLNYLDFLPLSLCLMYFWLLSPYEISNLEISSVNL